MIKNLPQKLKQYIILLSCSIITYPCHNIWPYNCMFICVRKIFKIQDLYVIEKSTQSLTLTYTRLSIYSEIPHLYSSLNCRKCKNTLSTYLHLNHQLDCINIFTMVAIFLVKKKELCTLWENVHSRNKKARF